MKKIIILCTLFVGSTKTNIDGLAHIPTHNPEKKSEQELATQELQAKIKEQKEAPKNLDPFMTFKDIFEGHTDFKSWPELTQERAKKIISYVLFSLSDNDIFLPVTFKELTDGVYDPDMQEAIIQLFSQASTIQTFEILYIWLHDPELFELFKQHMINYTLAIALQESLNDHLQAYNMALDYVPDFFFTEQFRIIRSIFTDHTSFDSWENLTKEQALSIMQSLLFLIENHPFTIILPYYKNDQAIKDLLSTEKNKEIFRVLYTWIQQDTLFDIFKRAMIEGEENIYQKQKQKMLEEID